MCMLKNPVAIRRRKARWLLQQPANTNVLCRWGRSVVRRIVEAIQRIHQGDIGKVLYSRTWYNNRRPSIESANRLPFRMVGLAVVAEPTSIDPTKTMWFITTGTGIGIGNGELGNNGVHGIDVARWGLDVHYPVRVTAGGGKYRHDDDQETPDTTMVTMDFPEGKSITWEGLSWSPLGPHDSGFGISFHGTEGSLVQQGTGYVMYDMRGKEIAKGNGAGGDKDHFADFLDGVRTGRLTNADIEIAHKSTLLCHLGNIAPYRERSTRSDHGHILGNPTANALWGREYAPGWKPEFESVQLLDSHVYSALSRCLRSWKVLMSAWHGWIRSIMSRLIMSRLIMTGYSSLSFVM